MLGYSYWKCNFPMNSNLSVGWLVDRSAAISKKVRNKTSKTPIRALIFIDLLLTILFNASIYK